MGFKKARPRILGERENRYQRDPVPKKIERLTGDHG
jgi:hypothetical protein